MSLKPNDVPPELPRLFTDMTIFQFREVKWETANGRVLPIREVEDTHLANIILHCQNKPSVYGEDLVTMLKQEATSRGLTDYFLSRAPIPYRRSTGKWAAFYRDHSEKEEVHG